MTQTPQRRGFNEFVTRFWGVAAPAYNLPFLQQWVYRPAHDEVVAQLRDHQSARVADIACGTGILADRIERELHPAEVYGVDMSEGMLNQARSRSTAVQWLRGPAEQLPFGDGAVDAVVTTSAFHFFDQPAALREFHRVLRRVGWWRYRHSAHGNRCSKGRRTAAGSWRTIRHHPKCGNCSKEPVSPSTSSTGSGGRYGRRLSPT